ncbi:ArsA family ATPase [Bradymonadaceae bacterium TMQ3]|uniref:ArsA family ATPase n=1 Tax=Lujinxingia sediminis TaxID=2480984 RepID=A0ABY0CUD6_9DELT|nr:ArsA-related P-loop ATPase [Lujinxingia sediminis]RDV37421.1 ArsA family ATPase [Bradymonadaceae bacterium TMQ3]RVU45882.1 ArsA family ATPase [Lujinxingia sediminis]TXC74981.1 ArsA family ATPase [Bradymonadales bacterium TMQ1]
MARTDDEAQASRHFERVISERQVVICVGSGGVGKTTSSAVIGLNAALSGRRVLVMTIDPARRLANSLGIEALGSEMQQIPLERFKELGLEPKGELWAMMLDMKDSFDRLVQRHAPDAKTRDAILDNRFYHYFSTSLAGTQEYAASERLHELVESGEFDLIVLDTPPTTHALDFLEAPERLVDAVSSRALQWLYKPGVLSGRSGMGIVSLGTNYVMRTLGKFTGGELLSDLGVFLKTFSSLFEGFEERARGVIDLLKSPATGFVVVTAPDSLTVEEALYFYEKLDRDALHVDAFIVNRVHPRWVSEEALALPPAELATALEAPPLPALDEALDASALAALLLENASQFELRASQDASSIALMGDRLPKTMPILQVPYFNRDIHSLAGLNQARTALFATSG